MNKFKRILVLLLVFTLCFQVVAPAMAIPAMAVNDNGVTYTATVDTPELSVSSEARTITVTIKANKEISLDTLTAKANVPNGFSLKSIANSTLGFTGAHYNVNNGSISWYSADGENATTDTLAVLTYTVPANAPADTYYFDFDITEITSDWYMPWEYGETVTATLRIKEAVPTTYKVFVDGTQADSMEEGADVSSILPTNPTKEGYTFKGWSFYKDAEKQQSVTLDGNKMPAHDLYVFGNWEENVPEYTLTFLNENGDELKTYTYKNGWNETPAYPAYTKTNYTITWSSEIPATLTGDVEITAIATANVYTMTFFNGEQEVGESEANVGNGWKATVMGNLTSTDKHANFKGWSATQGAVAADSKYTADAQIALTADLNLYAVWEIKACYDGEDDDHVCDICQGAVEGETCTSGTAVEENRKEATCTTAGSYDSVVYCTECGEKISTTPVTIPATGHTFGDITAKVDATCVAAGNEAYKQCTVCELYFAADADKDSTAGKADTSSFVIGKLEHVYTGAIKSDGDGKEATHSFKCVNGCDLYGGAVKHTWNAGEETTAPDCLGSGVKTYTCTAEKCGATYTETVNAKGHSFGTTTAAKAATCTEAGNYAYKQCETCGKFFAADAENNAAGGADNADGFVIPALGHTFGATTPAKAATCTEAGNEAYKQCTVCKLYFAETAAATATDGEEKAEAFAIEKDLSNHTEATAYKTITETQHTAYYPCCGKEIETVNHTYDDGYCACEKAKTIPVTVILQEDQMGKVNITLSNTTATFGQNFVATVTADKGTGIAFTGTNAAVQYCTFDEETKILTIPAKAITAEMETINVHFMATVQHTLDVNGGVISDKYKEDMLKQGHVIVGDRIITRQPYGITFELMQVPELLVSKIGHTYNGAKIQDGTYYPIGTVYTVLDDMTLTFQWEPKTYTVTWTVNGEPYGQPTSVKFGDGFLAPDYVVPEGYSFSGWDVPATMPDENLTLDATLALKTYTVAWNVDGTITEETYTHGETINLPTEPEKDGYRFEGWNGYTEGMKATEDKTFAAEFAKYVTVTYYRADIDQRELVVDWTDSEMYVVGDTVELPYSTWNYSDSLGWDINNDGEADYAEGAQYTYTEDVTFKPVLIPFYVDLDLNAEDAVYQDADGNKITRISAKNIYEMDATITNHPTRPGYRFMGWLVDMGYYGKSEWMVNENGAVELSFPTSGTATAIWKKLYTVTFTVDDQQIASAEYVEGETIAVPETPSKEAEGCTVYTFSGWTDAEGNDAKIPETMPAKDLTFTGSFSESIVHSDEVKYVDNGNGTHNGTCAVCGETLGHYVERPHDYTHDKENHKCICGAVETYTITWVVEGQDNVTTTVAHGETPAYPNGTPVKNEDAEYSYTFAGWSPEITAADKAETYTATWNKDAKEYKLTIKLGDHGKMSGTNEYTYTGDYGSDVELPEIVMDEGWKIVSWTANFGGEDKPGAELPKTMPSASGTYTAQWDLMDVTVTFKNGEEETTQTDKYFEKVTAPALTQEGHTFLGWDDNNNPEDTEVLYEGGAEITLNNSVKDKTLYAKWQANAYNITWILNGGSCAEELIATEKCGDQVTLPRSESMTKPGATFKKWTASVGVEIKPNDWEYGTDCFIMPAHDVTVTATWVDIPYTVSFKDADGEIITDYEWIAYYGDVITENDMPVPTKDSTERYDYKFSHWTVNGQKVTFPVTVTGDMEFVPVFTETLRKYDITFVVEGQEDKVVSTKYGETPVYDADGKVPTKASDEQYSYTFAGWDAELVPVTGAATYTATWTKTPVEYTVTVKIDGETVYSVTAGCGTEITYPEIVTNPTKTGHTFGQWDAKLPTTIPVGGATISGNFTVNQYTITFMNGETEIDTVTANYGEAITAPEVTKEGHALTGWADAEGNAFNMTIPAGDKTVYAQWEAKSYDVIWVIDGETYATTPVVYGTAITAPTTPAQDGYTFSGWSEIPEKMPAESVTITGSWTPIDYTITFKVEGMEDQSITAPYRSDITELVAEMEAKAVKEGYQFNCWMNDAGKCVEFTTMPLGGMIVTADFTVDTFYVNFYKSEGDTEAYASFPVTYGTDLNGAEDDPETEENESKPNVFAGLLDQVEAKGKPTKEGHSWTGWDTEDKVPETMPAKAVNIYGTWDVNSYTITWKYKAINWDTLEYSEIHSFQESYEYGATVTTNPDAYVPAGYNRGSISRDLTTMPAENVECIIGCEPVQYAITFDVDGLDSITAYYDHTIKTWPENPTKTGHEFQGWDKDDDGIADITEKPEKMPLGGLNLKAVWARNTIYITFKVEGVETIKEFKYGDPITVPEDLKVEKAADAKYTYNFTGWDPTLEEGATATESKTYIAQFEKGEKVKYTVSFLNSDDSAYGYTTEMAWGETIDLEALEGFTAPVKDHNTLSWTVDAEEVTFPYEMPVGQVTFVAQWTPETYTVTIDDGEPVTYAYGAALNIEAPTKEGHEFLGWKKDGVEGYYTLPETMPAEDIEITSDWKVNEYILTVSSRDEEGKGIENIVSVPYGTKLADYYLETPSYTIDGLLYEFQNWVAWTWSDNDDDTMVVYKGDTMPASDVKMYPTYTFTGWVTDESGTTYYTKSAMTYFGEWATIDGTEYWFNAEGYIVKDITLIDGGYYAFDHESGKFLDDMTGIYEAVNGDLYYVVDGMAVENKGLVKDQFVNADGQIHTHYYYFGCDATGCTEEACTGAGQFKAQMGTDHWVENTNGMLMKAGYTFGADGVIEHTEDTNRHGIQKVNGVKFYLMDGVKVPYGLFKDRGYYYYARSSGALVVNESYWVSASKLNGYDLKAGTYNFDEEGRIVFGGEKTGIYEEDGKLYYYVKGVKTYAGLIQYSGELNNADGTVTENVYNDSWIYVNTQGEVKRDCKYWISKTNGHMIAMSYTFDVNGIMLDPQVSDSTEVKSGVYAENGSLYYYVDNVRTYAGLMQYTGDLHNADGSVATGTYNNSWIYVNTQGEVKNNCQYWISKNNGYMKNGRYTFDESGIMTDPKPIA